ncbi:diguanylate cyclase domain-containing protein [Eubacterium ruminantium]|uniref:diguanylate cyclase domain-containing protein n=1 Tax=Eubacterium ruminantium TaxID=42322 RepID=UPI0015686A2B|nr:sensor domain-containing diguanylate cyclase [Eubacterium ruminantium]
MDINSQPENYIEENEMLKQQLEVLKNQNRIYEAVLDNTHAKIFWKDKTRRFVGANKAFLDYFGFESVEDIIGKFDEEIGWLKNPSQFLNDEMIVLEEGRSVLRSECKCIVNGQEREIIASKRPVYENGQVCGLVGDFNDVTDTNKSFKEVISELNKTKDQIKRYEFFDQLTGVLNRSGAYEVAQDLEEKYFEDSRDFASIYLDIVNFRSYNDSYGYQMGDDLLINTARRIEECMGDDSILARFAGDVFIILLRINSEEEIEELISGVINYVGGTRKVDGYDAKISVKCGYAKYSEFMDIDRMFLEAERRLFEAK